MSQEQANKLLLAHQSLESASRATPAALHRLEQRCQVVALHACGTSLTTISWLVDVHPATSSRWIDRLVTGGNLWNQERSGRPRVYGDDVRLKTIAFHCQACPLPGCGSWSLRWAEQYLKEHADYLGSQVTLSRSTMQRLLAAHALRPHRYAYYLAITDPDFFPKMDHITSLYLNPPEYLFNYDECTCLQAKAPLAPTLPPDANMPAREEFEYSRNGTTDLLAFLNPKTGKVFGRCTSDHTTKTLIGVFRDHVRTLPPDVPLHYVMDNLSPHYNDAFCRAVAELSGVEYRPLKTGSERRSWLQNASKRIVVHFTPFHGSWLNMIEIWFRVLQQRCLHHQAFQSVQALQQAVLDFIETWNRYFAHPFRWSYTGEGLKEKAIARFNKLLLIESAQMDTSFLAKQLRLMVNLQRLDEKIPETKEWRMLRQLLTEKLTYVRGIIDAEAKERRRSKANRALDELQAAA